MIDNINNNTISYETMNKAQNTVLDKKEELQINKENQKEQIRTIAVASSMIQQQEKLINTYMQNDTDKSIDLTGSNVDYKNVVNKYNDYNQQKIDIMKNQYNNFEEKIKENYFEIQSKGNFVDISV